MTTTLLPCPFCGAAAEEYPDGDMEGYSVGCSGYVRGIWGNTRTSCASHTFAYTTQEEANAAWNTRTIEQPTDRDELAEELRIAAKILEDDGNVGRAESVRKAATRIERQALLLYAALDANKALIARAEAAEANVNKEPKP